MNVLLAKALGFCLFSWPVVRDIGVRNIGADILVCGWGGVWTFCAIGEMGTV